MKTSSWFKYSGEGRIGIGRGLPHRVPPGYRMYRKLEPGPWFKSVDRDEAGLTFQVRHRGWRRMPRSACSEKRGTIMTKSPVRVTDKVYQVSGPRLTAPDDAAIDLVMTPWPDHEIIDLLS